MLFLPGLPTSTWILGLSATTPNLSVYVDLRIVQTQLISATTIQLTPSLPIYTTSVWSEVQTCIWYGNGMVNVDLYSAIITKVSNAQLMLLPLTVSCFSKIQIVFAFLVPADWSSRKKRPLTARACMCSRPKSFSSWWLQCF